MRTLPWRVADEFTIIRIRKRPKGDGWTLDVRLEPSHASARIRLTPRRLRSYPVFREWCFRELGFFPHLRYTFAELCETVGKAERDPSAELLAFRDRVAAFMATRDVWIGSTSMLVEELGLVSGSRLVGKVGQWLHRYPQTFAAAGVAVLRRAIGGNYVTCLHRLNHGL
jgi:hypothetical protein